MEDHSRRRFLRAGGVTLALPFLESLGFRAFAKTASVVPPNRLGYLYIPNGVDVARWRVEEAGADYRLSPTLEPLATHRADFTLVSGLNHENATPGPDGAGDHSRATAVYLTGTRPRKTGGSDIRNAISADQFAAQRIGPHTRLPSLEISTDGARTSGRCDSGYSCAYQFNLSWASPTKPVPAEQNPRSVFERLFGAGGPRSAERRQLQRSILDYVRDEARGMERNLGRGDREKLDQYFTAVRQVERRIEGAEATVPELPGFSQPAGIPESYRAHIETMMDLMVLAFQSDATRIITFMLAHDGSNRAFPEIGVPEAHHQLSHHRGNEEKLAKISRIDRFYTERFARFLERMKSVPEGEGSLLDHSMIVYGGGISDGNKHWHNNLPVVVAGRGKGSLSPGRHLVARDPTPMCNLHLALLHRLGLKVPRFGDSDGVLKGLG